MKKIWIFILAAALGACTQNPAPENGTVLVPFFTLHVSPEQCTCQDIPISKGIYSSQLIYTVVFRSS